MTYKEWQQSFVEDDKTEDDKTDLTPIQNGSKMTPRGDTMSLEYQRYGRNKETLINNTYINSGEYRRKFDNITNDSEVSRALYSKAKEMLKHRSGTKIEDMCWIDGNTGKIVASIMNEQQEERIIYTEAVLKAISGNDNLIALHTHPSSMPPSVADFNSTFRNGYDISIVLCHDGKIFQYVSKEEINSRLYAQYIQRYIREGYAEYDAQLWALEKLKENYDIDFWEVK